MVSLKKLFLVFWKFVNYIYIYLNIGMLIYVNSICKYDSSPNKLTCLTRSHKLQWTELVFSPGTQDTNSQWSISARTWIRLEKHMPHRKFVDNYLPAPLEGCQMVPKGCFFHPSIGFNGHCFEGPGRYICVPDSYLFLLLLYFMFVSTLLYRLFIDHRSQKWDS